MVMFMIAGLSGVHSELDMEDAEDLFLSFTCFQGETQKKKTYKTRSLFSKKTGSADLPPTVPRVPFPAGSPNSVVISR